MLDAIFPNFWDYSLYFALPALIVPFVISAIFFRTYPTRRAVWFWSAPIFASFLLFVFGDEYFTFRTVGLIDAAVVLAFLVDWASVAFVGKKIAASRTSERVASLGQPHDVELVIENRSKRTLSLEIADDSNPNSVVLATRSRDDLSELLSSETDVDRKIDADQNGARFGLRTIPAEQKEILSYRLIWNRRGEFLFNFIFLRATGFLGLWKKSIKTPCVSTFQVYPNICQLAQFDLLARASRLHLLGLRRTRRIGQDDEFECLRDYTLDDQYKFIDWKATAKRNKLIVRDFQASRNQRIMLAIDAGRMMTNRARGVTLFDAALNSSLALAYIALKQGDEVGCLIFSNETLRYVAPRGGMSQMNKLICGVYDIFPERVESRYDRAFAYLEAKSSKRSLVVLATNVVDWRNATQVENGLTNFIGKHLPLGLFFRDHALFDSIDRFDDWEKRQSGELDETPNSAVASTRRGRLGFWFGKGDGSERETDDELERFFSRKERPEDATSNELFYRAGAAAEILNWRRRTLRKLDARGALTLDVFPEDATAPLINKYLEIKARRLL